MNQKINTILLRGLRQCGFMYVSCGSLTKNKEKKKKKRNRRLKIYLSKWTR